MTDYTDLKERLLEYVGSGLVLEAAAAIADLEAERDALRGALEMISALDDTAECCGHGVCGGYSPPECCGQPLYGLDRAQQIARAALTSPPRTEG